MLRLAMLAQRISCLTLFEAPMRKMSFIAVGLMLAPLAFAGDNDAPPLTRQHELLRLLHQDCGSCHGLRLTGGLGPALTAGALKDKPDASLVATIVAGRRGTPMPPWQPFMTEEEARWLVTRLKEGDTDAK
jgi:cytochrome c55X